MIQRVLVDGSPFVAERTSQRELTLKSMHGDLVFRLSVNNIMELYYQGRLSFDEPGQPFDMAGAR